MKTTISFPFFSLRKCVCCSGAEKASSLFIVHFSFLLKNLVCRSLSQPRSGKNPRFKAGAERALVRINDKLPFVTNLLFFSLLKFIARAPANPILLSKITVVLNPFGSRTQRPHHLTHTNCQQEEYFMHAFQ